MKVLGEGGILKCRSTRFILYNQNSVDESDCNITFEKTSKKPWLKNLSPVRLTFDYAFVWSVPSELYSWALLRRLNPPQYLCQHFWTEIVSETESGRRRPLLHWNAYQYRLLGHARTRNASCLWSTYRTLSYWIHSIDLEQTGLPGIPWRPFPNISRIGSYDKLPKQDEFRKGCVLCLDL